MGTRVHLTLSDERSEKVERHRLAAETRSGVEVTNSQIINTMIDISSKMMDFNLDKDELLALIERECK